MTEHEPQRGPLVRKDQAEKIALFRYQLIRDEAPSLWRQVRQTSRGGSSDGTAGFESVA